MSPFSSWKSRRDTRTMSPWFTHTFFLILPRMWHSLLVPSKQVTLLILEVSQRHENDVTLVHPHLLPHLATDVAQPLGPIKASHLAATVAKHPLHLAVLL